MTFRPEIHVQNDLSAWATEAATLTLDVQRQALEERGRFLIALSGGRTPQQLYERLATVSTENEWAGTDFFFSDERCVPPDHPESNFHLANQALFRPLHIPQSRSHRMRGEHPDPHAGAMEYEDLLRSVANEAATTVPIARSSTSSRAGESRIEAGSARSRRSSVVTSSSTRASSGSRPTASRNASR